MDFSQLFFFLLFIYTTDTCSTSTCGNNGFPVRFPFQLQGQKSTTSPCAYPGFNLSCNNHNTTVIDLPYSGKFYVRSINYVNQYIQLYDPDNCLPGRILNGLNLFGSPFLPAFSWNYTILSCPSQVTMSRFTVIGCLSNSTTSVLAFSTKSFADQLSESCEVIATLAVPVPLPLNSQGLTTDLNGDLQLTWYNPDCRVCESEGGVCGFKNNTTSPEIGCFPKSRSGGLGNGLRVFRVICLIIVTPALTCAVAIGCFVCIVNRRHRSNMVHQMTAPTDAMAQQTNIPTGLDQSTIESYQKLVLGESRRLSGPNDITCPICLSEYCTKDTLRCIPECKHCFHADCIDEWLRMHTTCPVCRNSPSPAHHAGPDDIA